METVRIDSFGAWRMAQGGSCGEKSCCRPACAYRMVYTRTFDFEQWVCEQHMEELDNG